MAFNANELVNYAVSWDGYFEKQSKGTDAQLQSKTWNIGNKNITWFWKWLIDNGLADASLQGQPWCDGFYDFCTAMVAGIAKAKETLCGFDYYTPGSANRYKQKNRWRKAGSTPKPGEQIFFKNSERICHTGMVTYVKDGRVYTVEGNTSSTPGVVANGGCVRQKSYALSDSRIAGYGIPNWDTSVEPVPAPVVKGRQIHSGSTGLEVTASSLNIRTAPISGGVTGSYPKGAKIYPTELVWTEGQPWFKTDRGYVSGKYLTGWICENGKWWLLEEGYTYPTNKWVKDGANWYYFDANGWMMSGKWLKDKNLWYYLKTSGAMAKNEWISDNKKWYYLKDSGAMASNEVLVIHGEKFSFDNDGHMETTNGRGALV